MNLYMLAIQMCTRIGMTLCHYSKLTAIMVAEELACIENYSSDSLLQRVNRGFTPVLSKCINPKCFGRSFFVSDGFPNLELMKWNIKHISLPQSHTDYGNTPRGIGSLVADIEGYDFIAYLDADNWFHSRCQKFYLQ